MTEAASSVDAESDPAATPSRRLVLLPGMDGTDVLLGPLLDALPSRLAPDVLTYPERGPNTYEDLLPRVVEHVRSGPAAVVLGWSFSGPLALRAAQECPDHVRAVVLVATFVRPPLRFLPYVRQLVRTPLVATLRTLRRLPIWLCRAPDDPLRRAKAEIWRRVPPSTLATRSRAILAVDARAALQNCRAPLLYIGSSADNVVPQRCADLVRELRPDVETAMIPGGHFALYEEAQAGADAIADFVDRVT